MEKQYVYFLVLRQLGKKGEIKPYSPVNVIGKITNPDKNILSKMIEGTVITFNKI